MELSDRLARLAATDPSVKAILTTYAEIERVYRAALIASGQLRVEAPRVTNSAEVTLTFSRDDAAAPDL